MKWNDVWKKNFRYDNYGYIWDGEGTMVFSVDDLTDENDQLMNTFCQNIVNVLNEKEPFLQYAGLTIKDGCDLYMNDDMVGSFRGWGHLTGVLHLSDEVAAKVQDELINYVMGKISK